MQDKKTFKKNHWELKYDFGRQVRLLRENTELSFAELSMKTGIGIESLKAMELGNFHLLGFVFKLAKFYDKKVKIEFY